jgi:acetyl esterase/lipase
MTSREMTMVIAQRLEERIQGSGVELTPDEMRRRLLLRAASLPTAPRVSVSKQVANGVACEWHTTPGCSDAEVIVYLHGGGYVFGGLDTHRRLAGHLAAMVGMRVLTVGYRLAPEHPFPAAVEDACEAYKWVVAHATTHDNVVLMGDSAGAGLAVSTCLALGDEGVALPARLVLLSPWVDLTDNAGLLRDADVEDPIVTPQGLTQLRNWYLAGHDPNDPLVSPVLGDLRSLPPTLIHVGELEILRSDASRLADVLATHGVPAECQVWPGMIHVWHMYAGQVPEADLALQSIANWIRL